MERKVGKGRVISGKTARAVLSGDNVKPDFEFTSAQPNAQIDYIHRLTDEGDIYFLSSRDTNAVSITATFRITGKAPEIWDAVSGEHCFAAAYQQSDGRTIVPLPLPPCGSAFVVFRQPAAQHAPVAKSNSTRFQDVQEITGPWTVSFDTRWGGPASATFENLVSWTDRSEEGIRFYSGTAVYRKSIEVPGSSIGTGRVMIDLGSVEELAEVKVNGRSCGITWAPPFRVDITPALQAGKNELEIEVVNFWPNRIIGDASKPSSERLTKTNVRKLTADSPLMRSGLLGPVKLIKPVASSETLAVGH
jgi:hypothetical protein